MPCPCFEPERVAPDRQHTKARLPLLDEYDGLCHAGGHPEPAPASLRFQCCNRGYSRGTCEQFPAAETRSSLRYSIARQTTSELEIVCIEEQDHSPLRWRSVHYLIKTEELKPEVDDVCVRAQLLAFCRGFLARFCC